MVAPTDREREQNSNELDPTGPSLDSITNAQNVGRGHASMAVRWRGIGSDCWRRARRAGNCYRACAGRCVKARVIARQHSPAWQAWLYSSTDRAAPERTAERQRAKRCARSIAGLHVVILERDSGPDARGQGHSIVIRASGLSALRRVGLADEFVRMAEPDRVYLDPRGNRVRLVLSSSYDGSPLLTFSQKLPGVSNAAAESAQAQRPEAGQAQHQQQKAKNINVVTAGGYTINRSAMRAWLLQTAMATGRVNVVYGAAFHKLEALEPSVEQLVRSRGIEKPPASVGAQSNVIPPYDADKFDSDGKSIEPQKKPNVLKQADHSSNGSTPGKGQAMASFRPRFAVRVVTTGGRAWRCHVVVGADGVRSNVRRAIVGDPLVYHGLKRVGAQILPAAAPGILAELQTVMRAAEQPTADDGSWMVMAPGACLFVSFQSSTSNGHASSSSTSSEDGNNTVIEPARRPTPPETLTAAGASQKKPVTSSAPTTDAAAAAAASHQHATSNATVIEHASATSSAAGSSTSGGTTAGPAPSTSQPSNGKDASPAAVRISWGITHAPNLIADPVTGADAAAAGQSFRYPGNVDPVVRDEWLRRVQLYLQGRNTAATITPTAGANASTAQAAIDQGPTRGGKPDDVQGSNAVQTSTQPSARTNTSVSSAIRWHPVFARLVAASDPETVWIQHMATRTPGNHQDDRYVYQNQKFGMMQSITSTLGCGRRASISARKTPDGQPVRPPPRDTYHLSRQCVALIGDAAHPMTPFAGQGGNQSLIDGVELVEAIAPYLLKLQAASCCNAKGLAHRREDMPDAGFDGPSAIPFSAPCPPLTEPSYRECEDGIARALQSFHRQMYARVQPIVNMSVMNMKFSCMSSPVGVRMRNTLLKGVAWMRKSTTTREERGRSRARTVAEVRKEEYQDATNAAASVKI